MGGRGRWLTFHVGDDRLGERVVGARQQRGVGRLEIGARLVPQRVEARERAEVRRLVRRPQHESFAPDELDEDVVVGVEVGVRAQAGRRHPSVLHPRRRVRRRQVQQVARLQLRRQRVGHGAKVEQPSVVALGARAPLAPRRRRSRVVAPTRRRHVALRRLQRAEERVGAPVGRALRRVQPRPQRGRGTAAGCFPFFVFSFVFVFHDRPDHHANCGSL